MTTSQGFVEPVGQSKAFSLHLNGTNNNYVMTYAREHNVTRNRAVNMIIEEHIETATRKTKRNNVKP